jgi:hypothetical protein
MKKTLLLSVAILNVISTNAQTIARSNLDINNIKAAVNADGLLFGDGMSPMFVVPIGSSHGTIFASGLWLGGFDTGNSLTIAAQTYRQSGVDFFPDQSIPQGLMVPLMTQPGTGFGK